MASSSPYSPGPHIIRKIALGHSINMNCKWQVPIKLLAAIGGPDMQGTMEQLKVTHHYFYTTAKVNRLWEWLGIHPMLIYCYCCMVRPLALWEDNPDFPGLVGSDDGHRRLICSAKAYRAAHNFWPSPAQVFETLLGPPTTTARKHKHHKAAFASSKALAFPLLKDTLRRRAAALPAPVPAATVRPLAGTLPLAAAKDSPL